MTPRTCPGHESSTTYSVTVTSDSRAEDLALDLLTQLVARQSLDEGRLLEVACVLALGEWVPVGQQVVFLHEVRVVRLAELDDVSEVSSPTEGPLRTRDAFNRTPRVCARASAEDGLERLNRAVG